MAEGVGTLTDPKFWRRFGGWLTFGLWNPDVGTQYPQPPAVGSSTSAGSAITDSRALQLSAVFGCIRIITQSVGCLPLAVYQRQADDSRKKIGDHWLARLLERPNPSMTGQEFREAVVASLAGWGNSYCEILRNAEGRPVELWPLRPDGMQVVRKDEYAGVLYRYTTSGGTGDVKELPPKKILHIKGFGSDGRVGLSPLGLARETLGLTAAAEQYGASFFANGGKPSGVMTIDKLLQPNQRDQLRKQFQGMADDGAANGNRWWLLEAGLKYEAISIPPEDAQMLATRSFQIADIARYFGVPLHLLMEHSKDTSWGTGMEQQNLAFLTYCLQPYMCRIENAMARWLLSDEEQATIYCEHNIEGLLRADSTARGTFYSTMVQNGLYTRNEVRIKENLPKSVMKGMDEFTAQTNLAPVDKLGQQAPAPAIAPANDPPAPQPPAKQGPNAMEVVAALAGAMKDAAAPVHRALEKIDDAIMRAGDREPAEPPVPVNLTVKLDMPTAGGRKVRELKRIGDGDYRITETEELE